MMILQRRLRLKHYSIVYFSNVLTKGKKNGLFQVSIEKQQSRSASVIWCIIMAYSTFSLIKIKKIKGV